MHLDAYLSEHGLTDTAFAEKIGRDRTSVNRWRRGESIPDWAALQRISEVTEGTVSANDFVEIGAARQQKAANA